MLIKGIFGTSLRVNFRLYIVRVAYCARDPTSSSKYQLSNANGKEHLECVIHVDDIDLIAVDKIQNAGSPSTTSSISGIDGKRIVTPS